MRVIKRYSNRKLYDTHESRYVTLEQLGEVAKAQSIQVVEQGSERDITSAILAQIIHEQEKRAPRLPVEGLRRVIREGLGA